jgi:hypothetical protein
MFEDLKARPAGFTAREKTKLIVMVSLAAVLGCAVLGLKGCESEPPALLPSATRKEPPKATEHELARLKVRTDDVPLGSFDKESLDLVIREIRGGKLRREPSFRLSVPQTAALDPKQAAGATIETVGRVRSMDRDAYPDGPTGVDQLWAFALEGDDGSQVLVVHPASSQSAHGGAPADAFHPGASSSPLKSGDYVRLRGIYLQKRTGTVASVALSDATAVLVGREYRRTNEPRLVESIAAADWQDVRDRSNEETQVATDDAQYQILAWAQAKGHDAVAAMIRSGEIPAAHWGQNRFIEWDREIRGDKDFDLPDPREKTLAARGKVFQTTGVLTSFEREEWETIPNNVGDVGSRWKVWLISDFYHNAPIRFDSPYPLSEFEGVFPPPEKGLRRQRVRAFGVFHKNATFVPGVVTAKPQSIPDGMNREVTLPSFLLLHLEPDTPLVSRPYYQNPFFWSWVGLVVFGVAFFLVMHRIEKRESTQFADQSLRLRRRRRALEAAHAQAGADAAGAAGGDPAFPTAGDASAPADPADRPPGGPPPPTS